MTMNLSDLITAVTIFGLYEPSHSKVSIASEYCIYAGSIESSSNMTEYEFHLLEKAGWQWDSILQCFKHSF